MNSDKTNSIAEQDLGASAGAAAAADEQEDSDEYDWMGQRRPQLDIEDRRWEEAMQKHLAQMRIEGEPARNLEPLKQKIIRVCAEGGAEAGAEGGAEAGAEGGAQGGGGATLADVMVNQPASDLGRHFLASLFLAQENRITMEKPSHQVEPLKPDELRFKLKPRPKGD